MDTTEQALPEVVAQIEAALPELPKPYTTLGRFVDQPMGVYAAYQMRAYALSALAAQAAEVAGLRKIISRCVAALETNSGIAPECSLEMLAAAPKEIHMTVERLREDAERWRWFTDDGVGIHGYVVMARMSEDGSQLMRLTCEVSDYEQEADEAIAARSLKAKD